MELNICSASANLLETYLQTSDKFCKEFRSVSGHLFNGYLCCAENVLLMDLRVQRFYYFMSFVDSNTALLGDDFITYCGISHSIEGDFYVNAFSQEKYDAYFNNIAKGNHLSSIEIAGICDSGVVVNEITKLIKEYGIEGLGRLN